MSALKAMVKWSSKIKPNVVCRYYHQTATNSTVGFKRETIREMV